MNTKRRTSVALAAFVLVVMSLAGPAAADTVNQSLTIDVSGLTGQYASYGIVADAMGRECSSTCTFTYTAGSAITLHVVRTGPAQIVQLGSCGAVDTCTIFSDQPHRVDVVFAPVTTQVLTVVASWDSSMYQLPYSVIAPHDASVISTAMPPCHPGDNNGAATICRVSVPTFSSVTAAATTTDPSVRVSEFDSFIPCIDSWQVCTFTMTGPNVVTAMFFVDTLTVAVYCDANEWSLQVPCGSPDTSLTLTSQTIGEQRIVINPCGDPDYPCRQVSVAVPFGEVVHVAIEVSSVMQARFRGPCAVDVLECDVVMRAPTRVSYTLHDGRPDTPTGLRLIPGDQALTLTWNSSDPPGLGGLPTYTVTAEPGHHVVTTTALSATISGLTNDTTYSISVIAGNTFGAAAATGAIFGTPVPPPTDYTVPWSIADSSRIDAMAAYLGTDAAGVQRQAVYLTAFLIGLAPTGPPEPTILPPATDDIEVTSSWARDELSVPLSVERRFVLDGVDTHRFSVYLLSYLLSLTGH